jgi:GxxExxY protein
MMNKPSIIPEDGTHEIISAALEVHRHLGPGLLESAYEECLCHEFEIREICYARQKPLPIVYKDKTLDCGYRLDVVVNDKVLLELKSIEKLLPIHDAQILTYLKLSGIRTGLLINFNEILLKNGIKRIVF